MKKIKLLTILTLPTLIGPSFISLASCGSPQVKETFTINFVASDGGQVEKTSIEVKKGTSWIDCDKPKTFANDGYAFDDWYIGNQKVKRTDIIDKDVTITAKFISLSCQTLIQSNIYKCNGDGTYVPSPFALLSIPVYKFDNFPTGYIKLADIYSLLTPIYSFEEANKKSIITNTYHTDRKGIVTLDFLNQTITFDGLDEFYDLDPNSKAPLAENMLLNSWQYFNSVTINSYTKGKNTEVDLNKYNIRLIWYNNNGYVPFEVVLNILNLTLQLGGVSTSSWDFNGKNIYEIPAQNDPNEFKYKNVVKSNAPDGYYSLEYMEYMYNLLALSLDFRFGMTQRKSRAHEGKIINYQEKSALKVLAPYHDDIVSLEDDKSSDAIRKAIRENFDDGGHTGYMKTNVFSTRTVGSSGYGDELKYYLNITNKLSRSRIAAGKGVESGKYGYYEKYENAKGNIAYVTFDQFISSDKSTWTAAEQSATRELPSGTTETNYGVDTLRTTMYANQKIKDDNIKYLVLDTSLNGGGEAFTELFIASWICGGVRQKIYNPKTNAYCDFTVKADINGDGTFDENDVLSQDIKLFVITSTHSFSCGNILPCNIKDQRASTVFIGHNTGGGPCLVDTSLVTGANSAYQGSSFNHLLRLESTIDNPITMDDGIITTDWLIDEFNNPDYFYNRDEINKKIWSL